MLSTHRQASYTALLGSGTINRRSIETHQIDEVDRTRLNITSTVIVWKAHGYYDPTLSRKCATPLDCESSTSTPFRLCLRHSYFRLHLLSRYRVRFTLHRRTSIPFSCRSSLSAGRASC
uniref:(northern house mosquito) hypothetical protein n=1 Tax=Culex pipiens TaxID=7175 RepID=A0A8D8H311_CULPI